MHKKLLPFARQYTDEDELINALFQEAANLYATKLFRQGKLLYMVMMIQEEEGWKVNAFGRGIADGE